MDGFFCAPVWALIIVSLVFMLSTCMLVIFPFNMTQISSQFFTMLCCVLIVGLICQHFTDKLWIAWSIVGVLAVSYIFGFIHMMYNYYYPPTPVAEVVVSKINVETPQESKPSVVPQEEQTIKEPVGMEESVIKNGEHFAPF